VSGIENCLQSTTKWLISAKKSHILYHSIKKIDIALINVKYVRNEFYIHSLIPKQITDQEIQRSQQNTYTQATVFCHVKLPYEG
jgi:hypothetical protein